MWRSFIIAIGQALHPSSPTWLARSREEQTSRNEAVTLNVLKQESRQFVEVFGPVAI